MASSDDDMLVVCPAPEIYKKHVWDTVLRALQFVVMFYIVTLPKDCKFCDMPCEPRAVGKTAACRCGRRFKVLDVAEEDEAQSFTPCGGY